MINLDLSDTQITDAAVDVIVAVPSLRVVNLSGTAISDEGLMRLGNSKMSLIDVARTRVTQHGIAEFERRRPDAKVVSSFAK